MDLPDGTVPGAPRSYKTFFYLHLYLAGNYCKNPKVPEVQLNVNQAWAITWLVGVTINCRFFNNNFQHSIWPVFMQENAFEKKLVTVRKMLIEQIC